jgi:ribonuclease T2
MAHRQGFAFQLAALAAAVALAGAPASAHSHKGGGGQGGAAAGSFDYYILSLSWEPGFCATKSDPQECGKGTGFGLHGLWPQSAAVPRLENCAGPALTSAQKAKYQGLFASPGLITHEWTTHGTCSGLSADDYFALVGRAVAKVAIPAPYKTAAPGKSPDIATLLHALQSANPGLTAGGLKAQTPGGVLTEVRVCLSKTADFRACGGH